MGDYLPVVVRKLDVGDVGGVAHLLGNWGAVFGQRREPEELDLKDREKERGKTTKRPFIMIARRSQSCSASSIRCVVSKTEAMLIFLTMRLRLRRETGSTPLVGSSRKRTFGQSIRA